jgi:hypothetical protein
LKGEAHASKVERLKILNVRLFDEDEDRPSGYIFTRYELRRDGSLELSILTAQPVRDAMERGSLKARSAGGGTGDVVITDTPRRIAAFLTSMKRGLRDVQAPAIERSASAPGPFGQAAATTAPRNPQKFVGSTEYAPIIPATYRWPGAC